MALLRAALPPDPPPPADDEADDEAYFKPKRKDKAKMAAAVAAAAAAAGYVPAPPDRAASLPSLALPTRGVLTEGSWAEAARWLLTRRAECEDAAVASGALAALGTHGRCLPALAPRRHRSPSSPPAQPLLHSARHLRAPSPPRHNTPCCP